MVLQARSPVQVFHSWGWLSRRLADKASTYSAGYRFAPNSNRTEGGTLVRASQAPPEPQNQGVAVNGSEHAGRLSRWASRLLRAAEAPKPRSARMDFQALQKIIIGCQIRRSPRSLHTSPESQEWMTLGTLMHLDPTRRT
jgi:hypothetical protein